MLLGECDFGRLLLEKTGGGGEVDQRSCKAWHEGSVVRALLTGLSRGLSDLRGWRLLVLVVIHRGER